MLQDVQLEPSFSIHDLAARTSGLSGSDLKEICRTAAMRPFREQIASGAFELAAQSSSSLPPSSLSASPSSPAIAADGDKAETRMKLKLRPLKLEDFFAEEDVQGRGLDAPRALPADDGVEPLD
jgi:ATPase family AAA domain-containing protein 1